VSEVAYQATTHPTYRPGRTAAVRLCDAQATLLGLFGELHPRVREAWQLPDDRPVLLADFDLDALRQAVMPSYLIRDVPRFPATIEDLAVVVPEEVRAADVVRVIREAGGALLRDVRLFDVYRGEQIGVGKKSLAYSLTYQAEDRTLSDKDVEKLRTRIIRVLEGQLGAAIRG